MDRSTYSCIYSIYRSIPTLGGEPREDGGNNRSVMPFDVLGRTRATLLRAPRQYIYTRICRPLSKEKGDREDEACWGLRIAILPHERGIPSKHVSSSHTDYVPALCTHRPSLLPMEWISELWGLNSRKAAREPQQTCSFRGSKSRNKVSVGEPAEGSLTFRRSMPTI